MSDKFLWEMTIADLKEQEKLLRPILRDLRALPVVMNVHVYNEIWLDVRKAREHVEKAINGIKRLRSQGCG